MSDSYSKTLSCYLTNREFTEFNRLASLQEITANELVVRLIREYIDLEAIKWQQNQKLH